MTAELRLLIACCRWPRSTARDDAVRDAAVGVDWRRFLKVVSRHRVWPLARDALSRASVATPPDIDALMSTKAAMATRGSLGRAAETTRVQAGFDHAGIGLLHFKGSTLAMLAYGELGIKESKDVDLLVDPADIIRARRVLEDLGYLLLEEMTDERLMRFSEHSMECSFVNRQFNVMVDLHWRLIGSTEALGAVDGSRTQVVVLAGREVPTLEDDALFSYLCFHGAHAGWARLKWLADIGAFLSRRTPEEIERLHDAGQAIGAGRSTTVALLLCERLFGTPLAPAFLARLRRDRIARLLARTGLFSMAHGGGAGEVTSYSAPDLLNAWSRYLLVDDPRYFWNHAHQAWTSVKDRVDIPLPRHLHFLYHLIRLPSWIWRTAARAASSRGPSPG